jgi:hypothetical protein
MSEFGSYFLHNDLCLIYFLGLVSKAGKCFCKWYINTEATGHSIERKTIYSYTNEKKSCCMLFNIKRETEKLVITVLFSWSRIALYIAKLHLGH